MINRKNIIALVLVALMAAAPAAAKTQMEREDRTFIGVSAGYTGYHDSVFTILAKAIGAAFGAAFSLGTQTEFPSLAVISDHTVPIGADIYFEITPSFSMSAAGGCAISFAEEDLLAAPYADLSLYWRCGMGPRADFLLGGGLGGMVFITDPFASHWSINLASRFQVDISTFMAWFCDLQFGYVFLSQQGFAYEFFPPILHNITARTGLSFAL